MKNEPEMLMASTLSSATSILSTKIAVTLITKEPEKKKKN